MVNTSLALERLGSPIPSGIERATKKVWNKDLDANSTGDLNMEDSDQDTWKLVRSFEAIDLDNDYYIVKFSISQDYTKALTEGPWMVYGNYITIQPWSRDFSTKECYPSKAIVWMRMLGLSYRDYNKKLLRILIGILRKVVNIDYNTTVGRRGKFASFALVVDLKKPLKAFVEISGIPYCVEYEGLPSICYKCRCYGHKQKWCLSEVNDTDLARNGASESRPSLPIVEKITEGEAILNASSEKELLEKTRFNIFVDLDDSRFVKLNDTNKEKIMTDIKNRYGKKSVRGVEIQGNEVVVERNKGLDKNKCEVKVMVERNKTCHKVVTVEDSAVNFEVMCVMHELGIEKGGSTQKGNKVLAIKKTTKNEHKARLGSRSVGPVVGSSIGRNPSEYRVNVKVRAASSKFGAILQNILSRSKGILWNENLMIDILEVSNQVVHCRHVK
ncbi:hypothetical protein GOBAR_DD06663 [Gossypium barbadense]|nr:hypothetical protein GOBAR_DD06663 [Gossypium barbadense]